MEFIDQLKKEYKLARKGVNLPDGERVTCYMNFTTRLLSNDSSEVINYHYELLKDRENKTLYQHIRAAFKRRPQAEKFLLEKITTETDTRISGDILHILGGLRSAGAAAIARRFVTSDADYQREVALYVLGWTGDESDIAILTDHLLCESSSRLRITAAAAHRQIYYRLPDLKRDLLPSLKKGFEKENDDNVISWIIIMISAISGKRLGLKEDREDPYTVHGDLGKAKLKTKDFLKDLQSNN